MLGQGDAGLDIRDARQTELLVGNAQAGQDCVIGGQRVTRLRLGQRGQLGRAERRLHLSDVGAQHFHTDAYLPDLLLDGFAIRWERGEWLTEYALELF